VLAAGVLARGSHLGQQLLHAERLVQMPARQAFQRRGHGRLARHQHDGNAARAGMRRELQTVHPRHHQIEHDEVRRVAVEARKRVVAGRGAAHPESAVLLQRRLHDAANGRLVVDHKNVRHCPHPTMQVEQSSPPAKRRSNIRR